MVQRLSFESRVHIPVSQTLTNLQILPPLSQARLAILMHVCQQLFSPAQQTPHLSVRNQRLEQDNLWVNQRKQQPNGRRLSTKRKHEWSNRWRNKRNISQGIFEGHDMMQKNKRGLNTLLFTYSTTVYNLELHYCLYYVNISILYIHISISYCYFTHCF